MKTLEFDEGGRPLVNEDLLTLQSETSASVAALYVGRGAFIVSGCQVTGNGPAYNVGAGIVFIDGQLLRFYGAGAVTLPAQFQAGGYEFIDQRTYQTSGLKTCIRERVATLAPTDPTYTGGQFIPFNAWGGLTYSHLMKASAYEVGDVKMSATVDLNDYDSGVGKPGTGAWGWALCDGQSGRPDMGSRFPVGLNPSEADYDAVGKKGGYRDITLLEAHLPVHSHGLANAATDNDGSTGQGDTYAKSYGNAGHIDQARRTTTAGSNTPHENRPPYYVVAYLVWVGYSI
jgi:hypothetical protein